jgi:hypothetical protein
MVTTNPPTAYGIAKMPDPDATMTIAVMHTVAATAARPALNSPRIDS